MHMDAGLDTGDMLLREALPIGPEDTTGHLHDELATLGASLIVRALKELEQGELQATPQPAEGVSYARKVEKAEGAIDWALPAATLMRRVHAFNPAPGAHTSHAGEALKIWNCEIESDQRLSGKRCGEILYVNDRGIGVVCGAGSVLRLTTLQRAGGKRLPAAEFLRGHALTPGDVLGASSA